MNKTEARELTIKNLASFFESNGFALKKNKSNSVEYIRKNKEGFDGFASGTINFDPVQIIRYSVYKKINSIEKIIEELGKRTKLSRPISKDTLTLAFGYETLNGINRETIMPEMQTEEDLIKSVTIIKEFMSQTAIPLLDRFNDIREIDKEINGESPWETDWKMKFNLGGNFHLKRIIISFLSGSKRFNDIIEFQRNELQKGLAGEYSTDFQEALNEIDELLLLLKNYS